MFFVGTLNSLSNPAPKPHVCGSVPRFYFHLRNDLDVPDDGGAELPALRSPREHAARMARFEISQGVCRDAKITLSHRIEIEDENGQLVDAVYFRDVIQVQD